VEVDPKIRGGRKEGRKAHKRRPSQIVKYKRVSYLKNDGEVCSIDK
jgi:hypothetical protein